MNGLARTHRDTHTQRLLDSRRKQILPCFGKQETDTQTDQFADIMNAREMEPLFTRLRQQVNSIQFCFGAVSGTIFSLSRTSRPKKQLKYV